MKEFRDLIRNIDMVDENGFQIWKPHCSTCRDSGFIEKELPDGTKFTTSCSYRKVVNGVMAWGTHSDEK